MRKVYETGAVTCEALKGVSLDISAGDYVVIMGHSGSGKSTLMHLMGGLDSPTTGSVTVQGRRLDQMGETRRAKFRRENIGFVFQFFNLIDNLTVRANVELPALLANRNRGETHKRADALLERLGIADQAAKYPWEMSGGQQQRVAIARALINRPAVLLVDEPTGNLDSASSQAVLGILRDCHARGQTILMVTHDPRAAAEAKRVLFLHDGSIVAEMPRAEAQDIAQRLAELH
ncbi:MAG: ABC transporter ATP-binding protein [Anaerolineae bacterium]